MGLVGLILLVIIVLTSILLGFWILLADKKSKINIWFFAISVTILLWNIFAYLGYRSTGVASSLIYFRINFFAVSLYFIAFYFFTLYFPVKSTKRSYLIDYIITFLGILFAILSLFTNLIIDSVKIPASGQLVMTMGSFGNFFYLFTVLLTIYILFVLFKKNKTLTAENQSKTKFFLLGTILYAVANVIFSIGISFAYPLNYNYTQLGDFSAILFIGFTAYAIMKHQLFNIKVIATESIVIVLSLVLLIQTFISTSTMEGILKVIIWILATYGGYQLIKSVKREIKQKEDLAKLAKQLEEANEHLKSLDKLKDDFLSMAAHELNTPIAAISGYLSMILDEHLGGEVNPKLEKYLGNMFTASKRLALLVHDMLNVSRIESGRIHLVYVDTPIKDVIDQAIAEIGSKAKERKHTLVFAKSAKKLPTTWYDMTRITEVLINLIGNAIKYTDPGGRIEVRAEADDKFITVTVKDNGRGIPADKEKTVFEKFSQVDILKDEVKGTGLGMYIAKKFVELHKGKIWFESGGEGKGTTFFFTLPIIDKKPFDEHEGEGEVLH